MAGNFEKRRLFPSGKGMSVQYFDHGGVSNDRRLRRRNYHKSGVPSENRRERCENVKEVEQYISRDR